MRLIDADAYLDMMEACKEDGNEQDEWIFAVCRGGINRMPTIDPVKHGRWIANGSLYDAGIGPLFVCSECNADAVYRRNYCPTCGARMDGDSDA